MQNRVMFKRGGDDMLFAFGGEPVRCAFDRPVVALRAAAGKINLAGLCAERLSGLLARIFNGMSGFPPFCIDARRIAVALFQPGEHCRKDFVRNPGSRGVVRINESFHSRETHHSYPEMCMCVMTVSILYTCSVCFARGIVKKFTNLHEFLRSLQLQACHTARFLGGRRALLPNGR